MGTRRSEAVLLLLWHFGYTPPCCDVFHDIADVKPEIMQSQCTRLSTDRVGAIAHVRYHPLSGVLLFCEESFHYSIDLMPSLAGIYLSAEHIAKPCYKVISNTHLYSNMSANSADVHKVKTSCCGSGNCM